jgi:hypothetical protein
MDCTPPTDWSDLAEWRADTGYPADAYDGVSRLVEQIFDGTPDCPTMNTDASPFTYAGGCVTDGGYALELEGTANAFTATFTPTDTADGTWPTGTLTFAGEEVSSGTGSSGGVRNTIVATWSFEDAGATGLPLTGTLEGRVSGSWNGCGTEGSATLEGDLEGCAFDVGWESSSYVENDGDFESWTFLSGASAMDVSYGVCGTRYATWDGVPARLDEAWAELPLTDVDGDGCAAEDCDCDEGDASVYPGAQDAPGDGIDQDCDGSDDPERDDCRHVIDACPPDTGPDTGAPDTGPPTDTAADTGPPADTSADTSADTVPPTDSAADTSLRTDTAVRPTPSEASHAGCAATPGAPAGLLLGLVALLRRRR